MSRTGLIIAICTHLFFHNDEELKRDLILGVQDALKPLIAPFDLR